METEILNQFVNHLAMCELLSANSLITPSLAFDCLQVENFIKESHFDNNNGLYIEWWDQSISPIISELQIVQK